MLIMKPHVSPKVSVVVTAHNYGKYLPQALDSVINQRYSDWEMIVVNDGSTDNTQEILAGYQERLGNKMKILTLNGVGLAKASNAGIKLSQGQYIIRLDADDYFDENIFLIEATILDNDPHIHMVFSDYYRINKYGEVIDAYRLQKVNDEVKLLDRSPLAAGAMYRRECYDAIGGYNESLRYQEDYDFWIRFIDKYHVYNVNLPLMYYRKHNLSMSTNFVERMKARQYVKKKFVEEKEILKDKNIIALIPAMGLFRNTEHLATKMLGGKPLLAYTIEEALKTKAISRVIVSTEDQEIADIALRYGAEVPFLRPAALAKPNVPVEDVIRHLLGYLEEQGDPQPDYIAILNYNTPFKEERHITEAIDTILLYDADSVISVVEDLTFHWKPGEHGLTPVGYQKRFLRKDKETVYKETGAIYVFKRENLYSHCDSYLGRVIGHIEMTPEEAWRIESLFDYSIANQIQQKKQAVVA